MNKVLLIGTLLLLLGTSALDQSLYNIDKGNGFKEFKIGDPRSKWNGLLSLENTSDPIANIYRYKGSCCKTFLGIPVYNIYLHFKKKTQSLYTIELDIYRKNWSFESVTAAIEYSFGSPTVKLTESDGNPIWFWKGEKMILGVGMAHVGFDKTNELVTVSFFQNDLEKRQRDY